MNLKTATTGLIVSACIMVIGCAKIPDRLSFPKIKIEPAIKDNKEQYNVKFSASVQNENSAVVLMDVIGAVVFYDSSSNTNVMSLPFKLPVILPFETGKIEIIKVCSENEIKSLLILLGSDMEKIIRDKGLERSFSDDKIVKMAITSYSKKKILDILKGKLHEKN